MHRKILRLALVLFGVYVGGYLASRLTGSIAARYSQGHFELEFRDSGILQVVPPWTRTVIGVLYLPFMDLEQPLLKYYVDEPPGV